MPPRWAAEAGRAPRWWARARSAAVSMTASRTSVVLATAASAQAAAATENSIGASMLPASRCLAVRGVKRSRAAPDRLAGTGDAARRARDPLCVGRPGPVVASRCRRLGCAVGLGTAGLRCAGLHATATRAAILHVWRLGHTAVHPQQCRRCMPRRAAHPAFRFRCLAAAYGPSVARAVARSPSTSTTTVTASPVSA